MNKPDKVIISVTGRDYTIAVFSGTKALVEHVVEYRANGRVEAVIGEDLFDTLPVDLAAMLDELDVHLSDVAGSLYSYGCTA